MIPVYYIPIALVVGAISYIPIRFLSVYLKYHLQKRQYKHLGEPVSNTLYDDTMTKENGGYKLFVESCSEMINGERVFKDIVNLGPSIYGDSVFAVNNTEAFGIMFNEEYFAKKVEQYSILEKLTGRGLVTLSGKLWQRERRILTPILHFQQLKNYVPLMNRQCEKLIQKIKESAGTKVSASTLFTNHTFNIINETTLGGDFDSDWMSRKWTEAIAEMPRFAVMKIIFGITFASIFSKMDKIVVEIRRNVNEAIQRCKVAPDLSNRKDLLAKMVTAVDPETGDRIPDEYIISETLTFLFAGHESTSNLLEFTFHYLIKHPQYQTKLQYEVDTILGKKITIARRLTKFKNV